MVRERENSEGMVKWWRNREDGEGMRKWQGMEGEWGG